MSLYRLYVDEVGNHAIHENLGDNERYLTLFGVIVERSEMINVIQPDMRRIKLKFFQQDPDEPVIFHRKEITRFQGPFSLLYSDSDKRQEFGNTMLEMYGKWRFYSIAVTIDKREHFNRYRVWRHAPYHYCMEALLERYVLFLSYQQQRGDVMVEARGTKPDRKLKQSFRRLYDNGTSHVPAERFQGCLTSRELKVKKKTANICGLQLADLLAHTAHYDVLCCNGHVDKIESDYARMVVRILNEGKYNRNWRTGQIDGYGRKMLP